MNHGWSWCSCGGDQWHYWWRCPEEVTSKLGVDKNKMGITPWKESYDQLRYHIKKQKHYFAIKVCLVKAMVFPVVMYGNESWTIKKAECQRIDAFELWCWRRLLRVPWTTRRSNQSILKEISPGCSVERLMLKLNSNTLATSCKELTYWKRL